MMIRASEPPMKLRLSAESDITSRCIIILSDSPAGQEPEGCRAALKVNRCHALKTVHHYDTLKMPDCN
jgi:hypothetical protein